MSEPELTLEEMLNDPIVQLIMARDGVTPEAVRALATRARAASEPRAFAPSGPWGRPLASNDGGRPRRGAGSRQPDPVDAPPPAPRQRHLSPSFSAKR